MEQIHKLMWIAKLALHSIKIAQKLSNKNPKRVKLALSISKIVLNISKIEQSIFKIALFISKID